MTQLPATPSPRSSREHPRIAPKKSTAARTKRPAIGAGGTGSERRGRTGSHAEREVGGPRDVVVLLVDEEVAEEDLDAAARVTSKRRLPSTS